MTLELPFTLTHPEPQEKVLCGMVTLPHEKKEAKAMEKEETENTTEIDTPSAGTLYSETSLIRHSMGPENNVGLGGCWIIECLLPYLCMVNVPHIMVGLEKMLDYRGVGLVRFHCIQLCKECFD